MLLPLMEIDGGYVYGDTKNKKINQENKKMSDYIYLEKYGEILKYSVSFDSMSVCNAIERYIRKINIYEFFPASEKTLKNLKISKKFFTYVGKFRLEGNLFRTNNYLIPDDVSDFLKILNKKYIDPSVKTIDLDYFCEIQENSNESELDVLEYLCSNINIELVERYQIDLDSLKKVVNIFMNEFSSEKLTNIGWLIGSMNNNQKNIKLLGLEEKFDKVIWESKGKVKSKKA